MILRKTPFAFMGGAWVLGMVGIFLGLDVKDAYLCLFATNFLYVFHLANKFFSWLRRPRLASDKDPIFQNTGFGKHEN